MTSTSWNVRVDWLDHRGGDMVAEAERIIDALADLHPALNFEHDEEPGRPIRCSATVTLEAASLRDASDAALKAVEAATGEEACGLEVLTTDEFDRQLDRPQIPDLVGNADIAEMLGVSRQRAAQLADIPGYRPPSCTSRRARCVFARRSSAGPRAGRARAAAGRRTLRRDLSFGLCGSAETDGSHGGRPEEASRESLALGPTAAAGGLELQRHAAQLLLGADAAFRGHGRLRSVGCHY